MCRTTGSATAQRQTDAGPVIIRFRLIGSGADLYRD